MQDVYAELFYEAESRRMRSDDDGEDHDANPARSPSRMFLLGVVIWYNLLIWAAEWTYAAMTRARFPEERRMAPASPREHEGDER